MGHRERDERLARLQRYLTEHPGRLIGFSAGEEIRCPGRRRIREPRSTTEFHPCGYAWGRAGPDTTVYAQMAQADLGQKPPAPSLGPPPPIRLPSALFECPRCDCLIEFLYFYEPFAEESSDNAP